MGTSFVAELGKFLFAALTGLSCLGALLLPFLVCRGWRTGRWLPVVGPIYYSVVVPGLSVFGGLSWLLVCGLWVVLLGYCFPPNPFTFFFSPRLRRATFRALEHAEQIEHLTVDYTLIDIESAEPGRTIVRIGLESPPGPAIGPTYRFRVADDGTVETLREGDPVGSEDRGLAPEKDRPFA
jgi:hypothetical protein